MTVESARDRARPSRIHRSPDDAPPDRPDVFVSYSRVDADWVHGVLCPRLEAGGLDVWVDLEDIRGGASDWRATVGAGIDASRAVVFVMSPEAPSGWRTHPRAA